MPFQTSTKDAEFLEPEFDLPNDQMKLGELDLYTLYEGDWNKSTLVYTEPHEYKKTHQESKIIERCISQCTQPIEKIEKRLGRFFSE